MTSGQKRRLLKLSVLGSAGAFLTVWAISALIIAGTTLGSFNFGWNLTYSIPAAIGTFLAIQLCWRIMARRRTESRKRGVKYGFMSGLLSVFLTSVILTLGGVLGLIDYDVVRADLSAAITFTVFLAGLFLLFGGFMAPIIGAFFGYRFTKNPNEPE